MNSWPQKSQSLELEIRREHPQCDEDNEEVTGSSNKPKKAVM